MEEKNRQKIGLSLNNTAYREGINEKFALEGKILCGSPEPLNCCAAGLKGSVESSSSALNTSPTACPYPRHGSRRYSKENRLAKS